MRIRRTLLRLPGEIILSDHFVLVITILYFLLIWAIYPHMAGRRNLANLFSNVWPLLALVIGQMFVLIVGGIDLSQTSIMAVTSVLGAMIMAGGFDPAKFEHNPLWGTIFSEQGGLLAGSGWAVPTAILIMLITGIGIGLLNGIAVAKLKMPPFMVTLVAMSFYSGLAIYLTRSENIMHLPSSFIAVGKGSIDSVPSAMLIVISLAAISFVILNMSILGRWFYAVGQNIRTARVSGVPTACVVILAYVFSGFCAGLGSILYSARLEAGRPTLGRNLLLDVIGAAVIGGVSLYGGKGRVLSAVYGVLFFVVLDNSLNKMPLEFYSIDIIKGGVILLAALLDTLRTRIALRQTIPEEIS
jgi:ribose/xylose/arabinose/galactoside ABC-type transport system permease subunit